MYFGKIYSLNTFFGVTRLYLCHKIAADSPSTWLVRVSEPPLFVPRRCRVIAARREVSNVVINPHHLVAFEIKTVSSSNMAQSSTPAVKHALNDDYDLSKPITSTSGLRQGLTSYGDAHFSLFLRKVFIKALGYSEDALSRPIVGIINTYSALNPCHSNIPQLIEAVKRGVHLNGGLAVEFPTISIAESFSSPTSMFLRNLMSMDTEEMIKAQPLDACIMIGGVFTPLLKLMPLTAMTGCDKTVPAQLMGGISANKPVLPLVTGPMMPGSYRGKRLGACTDCRSNWAAYRAGTLDIEDISMLNEELAPTVRRFTKLYKS